MFSKIWLINILLAALVIFFAVKTHDVWFNDKEKIEATSVPVGKDDSVSEKQFAKRNLPSESSYRVIVNQNLFREERAEYLPEPEPEPETEPKEESEEIKSLEGFGRKISLYGVVLFNDYKRALVTNTDRLRRDSREKWVEKGDTVLEIKRPNQEFRLVVDEILKDRILLKSEGGEHFEILLYDKDNPKKRMKVAKDQRPTVVSPSPPQAQPGTPRSNDSARENLKKRVSRPTKNSNKVTKKDEPSNAEYEVIDTPFGEIKRRKQ